MIERDLYRWLKVAHFIVIFSAEKRLSDEHDLKSVRNSIWPDASVKSCLASFIFKTNFYYFFILLLYLRKYKTWLTFAKFDAKVEHFFFILKHCWPFALRNKSYTKATLPYKFCIQNMSWHESPEYIKFKFMLNTKN